MVDVLWSQSQISNQLTDRSQLLSYLIMPPRESSAFSENLPDPKLLPPIEVDEMLASIQHSHRYYYKMMNIEVWALVETLDAVFPGAWGEFMSNRQIALKHFLQRDHDPNCAVDPNDADKDAETIGIEEEEG